MANPRKLIGAFTTDGSLFLSLASTKLKERTLLHQRIKDLNDLQQVYTLGEVLGKGSFGTVVKANHKESGTSWAIKIIHKHQAGASRVLLVEREIYILKLVNHPSIIFLDRVFESSKTIYLVFELCKGSLAKSLKLRKRFEERETIIVMRNLAGALSYLHKHDIVHRDLKLENILIAANPREPDDDLHIKLTDFGLSALRGGPGHDNMLHDFCGTPMYMAPEMITTLSYSQQCDVWSMGIIMYVLLVGKFPFYSSNELQLRLLVKTKDLDFRDLSCSPGARHVLAKMLEKNPAFRLTAAEVEHHPWITGAGSRLSSHSSNILDMMKMWKSEMREQSPVDNVDAAGASYQFKSTNLRIPDDNKPARTPLKSRFEVENSLNESPYTKHKNWLDAQGSTSLTPGLVTESKVQKEKIASSSAESGSTSSVEQTSSTAIVLLTRPSSEKQRNVDQRFRTSQLPDFSHIPAKVDSNLTNLRKEAHMQRKSGLTRKRQSVQRTAKQME